MVEETPYQRILVKRLGSNRAPVTDSRERMYCLRRPDGGHFSGFGIGPLRTVSRCVISQALTSQAPHRTLLGHKLQLHVRGQSLIEQIADIMGLFGAPGRIRTSGPQIRSLMPKKPTTGRRRIVSKRAGKPVTAKAQPCGENILPDGRLAPDVDRQQASKPAKKAQEARHPE